MKFQAIKGVRDILPPESALWNRVEQAAREVFRTYGYGEIRLPIFEPTELFARSVGLDTDIVSKEMYAWEDHGYPELEALRGQIMLRQPSLDQPVAMGLFHAQLDDFLAKAKEGIQRGEIPRTPINSRVVTDLGAMVRHIFDPNTTQGLMNDLVPSLKDMIAKFEIGDSIGAAAGGDGFGGARVHRAWDADAAGQREALLHGADVPARTAAEGALPAVLSDRRGSAGAVRSCRRSMRK